MAASTVATDPGPQAMELMAAAGRHCGAVSLLLLALITAGNGAEPPELAVPAVRPLVRAQQQEWRTTPPGRQSADTRFIERMIPHHDGAIAMAELALQRSRRAEIRALAERIRSSQSRENAQMRRWYRQWFGAEVPLWPAAGSRWPHGMGMGPGQGMAGLTTSLEALRAARDVDRTFLERMIAHHRMGVMMASHAQWNSLHPELRALEAAMVRVQSEEIALMERWYRAWFGLQGP